jgi:acrylyl-CoA reductase (NADPH)
MAKSFRALILEEAQGKVTSSVRELDESALPEGDVTVAVEYSTLNYKDGLIVNGLGRLVRTYPHVPGIDFAGTVEASSHRDFKAGDKVILTGWRVGEVHWGGYATKARVKADWLVPVPKGLDTRSAMAIGTAGFTSMLAVMALEDRGLAPAAGEVAVTGAAGGVGSVATAILANRGYHVVASTGRAETHDYLRALGAKTIIDRKELGEAPTRPLGTERFAGAVDSVGGNTLASLLTQMKYGGSVSACGLAGGAELKTTVLPFLLRGVNLLGVNSAATRRDRRLAIWQRIAGDLAPRHLDAIVTRTVSLTELPQAFESLIAGSNAGRTLVRIHAER